MSAFKRARFIRRPPDTIPPPAAVGYTGPNLGPAKSGMQGDDFIVLGGGAEFEGLGAAHGWRLLR